MAAYFQAISTRTAGFNTVDISALSKLFPFINDASNVYRSR
ncbi:potassium transporter TrkG [Bacillus pacificus]